MEKVTGKRIGIVLSGGGARGIVHLGVLKALDEYGLSPQIISGVSSGAIVGAFYAAGYSPEETLEIIKANRPLSFLRPTVSFKGLFLIEKIRSVYGKYFPENFENLNIPLIVAATELEAAEQVFFSSGSLADVLAASGSLPGIFEPVLIGGRHYIDGGILNNLPTESLRSKCDFLIGVHSNPLEEEPVLTDIRKILERTFHLVIFRNIQEHITDCDLFIEPEGMKGFKAFDLKAADEMFDIGYREGCRRLESDFLSGK